MLFQEIFDLIAKMNQKEKAFFLRYSKLYSEQSKKRHYMTLYDEIYQQVQQGIPLDERRLTRKLRRKFDAKSLSNYKQYLHQQLLQSLVLYHKNATSTIQATNAIQMGVILYEKGQRKLASRILRRSIKHAESMEDFEVWMYAISMQISIWVYDKEQNKQLNEMYAEVSEKYYQVRDLSRLAGRFFFIKNREAVKRSDDPELLELSAILEQYKDIKILSNKAKLHWAFIRLVVTWLKRDHRASLEIRFEALDLIEKGLTPFFDREVALYTNLLKEAYQIGDLTLLKKYEIKLKEQLKIRTSAYDQLVLCQWELFYYGSERALAQGFAVVEKVEQLFWGTNPEAKEITPLGRLYLIIDVILCLSKLKAFEQVLHWMKRWNKLKETKVLLQQNLILQVLEAIAYLELEDWNNLGELLPAMNSAIADYEPLSGFTTLLINFFEEQTDAIQNNKAIQPLMEATCKAYEACDWAIEHPMWRSFFDFGTYFQNRLETHANHELEKSL